MRKTGLLLAALICAAALVFVGGCAPAFPNCKTDEHCKSSANNGGKIACVNGQCQECANDKDCGSPTKICKANRCEAKPECEQDKDCTGGLVCKSQKCVPECAKNEDCGQCQKCENTRCISTAECLKDGDCKDAKVCESCKCVVKAPPPPKECTIDAIHFDFDKYEITADSKAILQKNADCIKQKGVKAIVIEGNCDERGTTEYNMSLGLNRANAAKKLLQGLGVTGIKTVSYGKEKPVCGESVESCWYKNRRDDIVVK